MQRWRHAGVGPRCALLAGVLLGVASLALYQSAYAAEPPYPGPPGLPGIGNGPSLGCNNPQTTNQTWVSGFNPLSTIHFKVNGHPAGTAQAMSNGAVFVVLAFLAGQVEVDDNAPVAVHSGTNYLIVEGLRTSSAGTREVGLRLAFRTPVAGSTQCVTTPTTPPTTPVTQVPPHGSTTFPSQTTFHRFYPTTLAKVLETPLVISPNKVILESSLLAGVLAAALSAGALGAMWGGSDRDGPVPVNAVPAGSGASPDQPEPPTPAPDTGASPPSPIPPPVHEAVPEPEPAPAAPAPPSASARPTGSHAFVRRPPEPNRGVT